MTPMKLMLTALLLGLLTGGYGLYLLMFTSFIEESGQEGIYLIVTLITVGVFLLVPAKIYIIIRLTSRERYKSRKSH